MEILGFAAGSFLAIAFIPQIWRLFRLKSAKEISLLFTVSSIIGVSIWVAYGVVAQLPPVIFWNIIMLILFSIILFAKLKYGR